MKDFIFPRLKQFFGIFFKFDPVAQSSATIPTPRVSSKKRTVSKCPKRKTVAKKRHPLVRTFKSGPHSKVGRSCRKPLAKKRKTQKACAAPQKKKALKSKPRKTTTRKCVAKRPSKPKRAKRPKRCLNASQTAKEPTPEPEAPLSLPKGNEPPEVIRLSTSPAPRRRITRRPVARPRNLEREPEPDSVTFIPTRADEAPAKKLKTKVSAKKVIGGRTTAKPKPKLHASG
ncbi:hypothetical protein KR026_000096 [Drosophila bipectinata]|nr:hypothetical protein KR026_000096 [Drosophila bipectinata]